MGNKVKNKRLKCMQLSRFFVVVLKRGCIWGDWALPGRSVVWYSAASEVSRSVCVSLQSQHWCFQPAPSASARLPSAALTCNASQWLLKEPSQGKPGTRSGTFLCLSPPERHLIVSCPRAASTSDILSWRDPHPWHELSGALSQGWPGRGRRAVRSTLSSLAVSDCGGFRNFGFRFSAHIAVFVTFGCTFKTSFAT